MTGRVAVVSGSNTGIGLATVRALCKQLGDDDVVYLTSRNEGRGKAAVDALKREGLSPSLCVLDIDDESSVERLRDHLKAKHGGLDILVNNAGIAMKDSDASKAVQAERTIGTNYLSLLNTTNKLMPLIRPGGRIVHVATMAAVMAFDKMSEEMKKRVRDASTEEEVTALMTEYVDDVKAGRHVQKGWADSSYGTSKLGVIALTRIQGRSILKDPSKKDVLINACCPGFVETSMTSHIANTAGMKTPDEAAENPIHLALLPLGAVEPQGQFLSRKEVRNFLEGDIGPLVF